MGHVALKGVVQEQRNFTESKKQYADHGTAMAGVIAGKKEGVARGKVRLYSGKVLDKDGDGQWQSLLKGLMWVVEHHEEGKPAVLNLSLGGEPDEVVASVIEKWVRRAVEEGIVVVVAAGNEASDPEGRIPSTWDFVISVGAVDENLELWEHSNFGDNADFYTLGVGLRVPTSVRRSSYERSSGTSLAAASVAGEVVRFLVATPGARQDEVRAYLDEASARKSLSSKRGEIVERARVLLPEKASF